MGKRKRKGPPLADEQIDRQHPALSEHRPLFVDNREGNSMERAIKRHLQALRQDQAMLWGVSIASAFFNVPGFNLIADELERVGKVQLLLGAEPRPEATLPDRQPGDPNEPEFTRRLVAQSLEQLDDGLRHSCDLLPFDEETDGAIRRLLNLLHSQKVEVKRYERSFLHAKAYVFRVAGGGLLVGSSNLTYAGMRRNLELNLGHYEDPVVDKVETWFDELWDAAAPYDLAAIYDRLMAEYPPYLIYLRVLYELYGDELAEELAETGDGDIPITQFQKHGVWRALRILKQCGGVLIADGVGLGKTFSAGEIIRMYRDRRQRVLLVCPAALRDSTWKDFLYKYQFDRGVECVSYEELARDRQFGGDVEHLQSLIDEYSLVVIDEAHNYRNPDAPSRAGVLRYLLMGQRRDVVMLSATPVNNSLWDLYHLLRYFIKQDAKFADRGVLSIRKRFEDAMHEDPFDLNPDMLYPIIDASTVKRTRRFIKKYYENDLIPGPDGVLVPIKFPKPVASTINYDLDTVLPGFLDEIEDALMPLRGNPRLTLARYQPENYPAGQPPGGADQAIIGLLRSGLLKRFESSVYAFAQTTAKMVREHDLFLRGLDDGKVIQKELIHELSAADDEDEIEELLGASEHVEDADNYDVDALRAAVEADRDVLDQLRRRADTVERDNSPKLAGLIEELARIAERAEASGIDDDDRRRKRKVIVFSFYADTIDWIEGHLNERIDSDPRLAVYRGRMASVSGQESRHHVSRDDAVHGFAPESSGAMPAKVGEEQDRFDILLSTDVLAEGMNLQQCGNIINFDLPWNPMRLVQRHGRIDRINSRHNRVFLRTFFPDRQLDRLLNLEARVRRKLAQAAASVGVEVTPIERGAEGHQSFSENREEIERLRDGDAGIYESGGTDSTSQSGEEYRQELRRALEQRGDEIKELPWKAGSGMAKGDRRGHFFCSRIGERIYLRFVPIEESGDANQIISEIGTCLRMIECNEDTERLMPLDLKQTAFSAWQVARQNVYDSWTYETDPANLQPKVSKLSRDIAEFLRDHPSSAIEQTRMEKCLDAIEAPCSRREENILRAAFDQHYRSNDAKSQAIVEEVERIGLEPFQAPSPLPQIDIEDVHLICWLAIDAVAELNRSEEQELMAGQIYLLGDDSKLLELVEAPYDSEALLQELLANYPNLLAGEQMDLAEPRRWILVAREFGVPGEQDGSQRWSLDHLFIDQDGVPTLVEVKRSTDTRIRREVVGQLLDYAANAVSYWSIEEIRTQFEANCEADEIDIDERLAEFLGVNADISAFWESVKTNLQAGRIRMVFVADSIPAELRSIVEFLNRQMDPAEVFAVEIKQFVNETIKTLVPKVYGHTAASKIHRTSAPAPRERIDEQAYLDAIVADGGPDHRVAFAKSLIQWARLHSMEMNCRRGARDIVFIPGFIVGQTITYPVTCKHRGRLVFQMRFLAKKPPFADPVVCDELQRKLEAIPGWELRGGMEGLPFIAIDELTDEAHRKSVLDVLDWIYQELQKPN